MHVPERLPIDRLERVHAWGGTASVMSWVYRPSTIEGVRDVLALARRQGRHVGLRGAGQSYGDATLAAEGISLDLSRMTRILDWQPDAGLIDVEPGVTIGQLWRFTLEDGWWPAVVPGTMAVSLGGGASMNVHGKNAWKVGPIGDHIQALDLLLPSGEVVHCTRADRPDLFHAVIGGFGMLGVVVRLRLALKRVHSGLLDVEALSARSLEDMLACFEARLDDADYLVGWIDTLAQGTALGRGLVHAARHLPPGRDARAAATLRASAQELPSTLFGIVPKSLMWRFIRPTMVDPGVRAVNAAKYLHGRLTHGHRYRQSHAGFHFLFDYVPDWRRAYGPGGLIQFQSFVPTTHAHETFARLLGAMQEARLPPYIGVLKRHRPDAFLLTHGVDGYSLACDFKVTPRRREPLWALAARLAAIVREAGGRFYPAKDSTLDAATYEAATGADQLRRFRAHKAACDPEGLLETELSKRLLGAPSTRPG